MSTTTRRAPYNPSVALQALRSNEKDGRVFALNSSDLAGRRDKGAVNIGITMRNSETRNVLLPNTWIPIDLSQQMPKDELLNSPAFLTNVMRGIIMLVDSDTAEKLLSDPDNMAEQTRLFEEQMSLLSPEMDIDKQLEANRNRRRAQAEPDDDDEGSPALDGVSAKIQEAVGRSDLTPQQRYAVVKNAESTITVTDLKYIMNNSEDQRLVELASNILKEKGLLNPVGRGGFSAEVD